MELLNVKNLSKRELRLIADMRRIRVKKTLKKDKLFQILRKNDN